MNLISAGSNDKNLKLTTATEADVLKGQTFLSQDKELKTGKLGKDSKTVTPTTSEQIVYPNGGNLLEKVTVSAIKTESKTVTPYNASQSILPTSGYYINKVSVPQIRVKTGYVYIAGANTTSAETTIDLGGTYKILSVSGFGFRASTGYATFIKDVKIDSTTILSESGTSNGIVQWSSTQGRTIKGSKVSFKGCTNGGGYFGYVGIVVTYC